MWESTYSRTPRKCMDMQGSVVYKIRSPFKDVWKYGLGSVRGEREIIWQDNGWAKGYGNWEMLLTRVDVDFEKLQENMKVVTGVEKRELCNQNLFQT